MVNKTSAESKKTKFLSSNARRFLSKKKNSKIRGDMAKLIEDIGYTVPSMFLRGSKHQLRRVKWKGYRIIYKVLEDIIIILSIGLRENCYKKLKRNRERFLRLDYTSCQPFVLSSYCN